MNIFYAPPEQKQGDVITLEGQEARHASRVLRYQIGDAITVVDGRGGRYEGKIVRMEKDWVQVHVADFRRESRLKPEITLGMGIIKKRDRLEFAVEKAVELGASGIELFRSEHTVKQNVRMDRLEMVVQSAMKQSLRSWLPPVQLHQNLEQVLQAHKDSYILAAHEKINPTHSIPDEARTASQLLLLIGPEGGFSEDEISLITEKGASLISLGNHRLRTETAAIVGLSQFIYDRPFF